MSVGFIVLVGWLFDAAMGQAVYDSMYRMLDNPFGLALLIGWSFAFFFHLANGIRHLVWDAGYGFEISAANGSAWFVLIASVVATALFWWVRL